MREGLMRAGLMRAAAQAVAISQWLCWAVIMQSPDLAVLDGLLHNPALAQGGSPAISWCVEQCH